MSEQPYRSPVMDKLRPGDRIVRDGMMLEFIEEELEGQKFIPLGPVPPAAQAEIDRLRKACARQNEDVCQVLGKALGYPWFKDDPANFPDATEEHGVCVSDHVAESLADEAAARIKSLEARAQAAEVEVARLTAEREKDREALQMAVSDSPPIVRELNDKAKVLESELNEAIAVAWGRGALDWVRRNHPAQYRRLKHRDRGTIGDEYE